MDAALQRFLYGGQIKSPLQPKAKQNRGNPHPTGRLCKLTEAKVTEMRDKYRGGGYLFRELGVEYGVKRVTAMEAVRGIKWGHVPNPVCRNYDQTPISIN